MGLNPSKKIGTGKSVSIKRLYQWLDELELGIVSFTNLYEGYEIGPNTSKIEFIKSISKDYEKIITLGSKVSDSLRYSDINHFGLPHPSGLNRQTNNISFIQSKLSECRQYLRGNQ